MAVKFTDEYEPLPGSDRRRSNNFPTRVGEVLSATRNLVGEPRSVFPFEAWARENRFTYPESGRDFLSQCGSAAEAFFVRPLTQRPGVEYRKGCAVYCDTWVQLQRRVASFFVDVAVARRDIKIAVEVDGFAYHGATWQATQSDYRRQRCLVLNGWRVIRFGAKDAMHDPEGCWAEIDTILDRLTAKGD